MLMALGMYALQKYDMYAYSDMLGRGGGHLFCGELSLAEAAIIPHADIHPCG